MSADDALDRVQAFMDDWNTGRPQPGAMIAAGVTGKGTARNALWPADIDALLAELREHRMVDQFNRLRVQ